VATFVGGNAIIRSYTLCSCTCGRTKRGRQMTLILVMGNQQQVVLVSDGRLTHDGVVVPDPFEKIPDVSNKAAVLSVADARLGVAYSGLAWSGSFMTGRWLPAALADSAAPDYLMGPTIERFRERATRDFAKIPLSRPSDKHLSVVLAGYCYGETPPRCYCWLVSNFESLNDQQIPAGGEFAAQYYREKRPMEKGMHIVLSIGASSGIRLEDYESLRTLLRENKPARALVDKGIAVIRRAADSVRVIGKNCTSIVLPSNPSEEAVGGYHPAELASRIYGPSLINARGDGAGVYVIADPWIEAHDSQGKPSAHSVPNVGRNQPCPCGSGLKYKKCHGSSPQT
jgi:hypothetical protein